MAKIAPYVVKLWNSEFSLLLVRKSVEVHDESGVMQGFYWDNFHWHLSTTRDKGGRMTTASVNNVE